jgi:hypothetical protein
MAKDTEIAVAGSSSYGADAQGNERQGCYDVAIYYTGDSTHADILRKQLQAVGRRVLSIQNDLCGFWIGL